MSDTMPTKWDASHIASQKGKVAIVTGSNSGIGFVTARELARHGAHVVLACRNEAKGTEAVKKIQQELASSSGGSAGSVEFRQLDVSSLAGVKTFTTNFQQSHNRLDILVNNAGIMAVPYALTEDGLESQMATNHFGHFALTAQLFGLLQKSDTARIVNISSVFHRFAVRYDEDQVMRTEANYNAWMAYADSKLANLLFTQELTRRMQAKGVSGVVAIACHPGVAATNLGSTPIEKNPWYISALLTVGVRLPIFQSAEMGALPTLYAATAPHVASGQFYGPNGFGCAWGYPTLETPTAQSQSESAGRKLWEVSEKRTGTAFAF